MKMYKGNKFGNRITQVEVIRKTDKSVFLVGRGFSRGRERREAMDSDFCHYRETFDEAKAELVSYRQAKLVAAQNRVSGAESKLAEAEAVEPPESPR